MARRLNREHLDQLRQSGRPKDEVLTCVAEAVEELGEAVGRLERAIVGDEATGHTGIIKRQTDHHRRLAKLERLVIWGAGAAVTLGVLWQELKSKLIGPQ